MLTSRLMNGRYLLRNNKYNLLITRVKNLRYNEIRCSNGVQHRAIHSQYPCRFSFSRRTKNESIKHKSAKDSKKTKVQWFHASDVPISKPKRFEYVQTKEPEKFIPFSVHDSKRLERTYQKYLNDKDEHCKIEVNEDRLFEVDLELLQLSPVFWDGPIFEVRRGIWFNSDGLPLATPLTAQLEQRYTSIECSLLEESSSTDIKDDLLELSGNKLALFLDSKTACIFPDSMNNKFQLGVIRNVTRGPLLGVEKITRGYSKELESSVFESMENPLPGLADILHREVSSLFSTTSTSKSELGDDAIDAIQNQEMASEMENDYTLEANHDREVEHLVLCVHGIGQILGLKNETINFTHSINMLRKTMKDIYVNDPKCHQMAYPEGKLDELDESSEEYSKITNNCKVQVLPISWRHRVDFNPHQPSSDLDSNGLPRLPSLSSINVEGVLPLRGLVGDLLMDILLYFEPEYLNQILGEVTKELNRVYNLYLERNPNFKGKVHILGHSLGSAISFDIMSNQPDKAPDHVEESKHLAFDVDKLFLVGSPIGVFDLLKRSNIGSRQLNPYDPTNKTMISPKVKDFYNIFHPCDPVGYRMEPLINTEFAKYRAERVPFTAKGLSNQIRDIADLSGEFSQKVVAKASSVWYAKGKDSALGGIVSELSDSDKSDSKSYSKMEIPPEKLKLLANCNKNGRVDYQLSQGVFDISLVSAISAHVSYFEDVDTAGFILKEILANTTTPVKSKTALVLKG